MSHDKSKNLEEIARALSLLLKANPSSQNFEDVYLHFKQLRDFLVSAADLPDAARQVEVSRVLAMTFKYSLVEAHVQFMTISSLLPLENDWALYSAFESAHVFIALVSGTRSGKDKTMFLNILSNNSYSEQMARFILSRLVRDMPSTPGEFSLVEKVVKLCSHELDQTHRKLQQSCEPSSAILNSYKSVLLCVFLHLKFLISGQITKTKLSAASTLGTPQNPFPPSHSGAAEFNDLDAKEAFVLKHLFVLHEHLLQAVKLLQPKFESVTSWNKVGDILLEEDLRSIKLTDDCSRQQTPAKMRECVFQAVCLLLDMIPLQSTTNALEEVIMDMAVEVMAILGPSDFKKSLLFCKTLGSQIWKRLQKDPYRERNARITVRLFFAMQLNLEAIFSLSRLEQHLMRGLLFNREVIAAAVMLCDEWMGAVGELWSTQKVPQAKRHALLKVMHEEALEVLIERQIRWICGPKVNWVPLTFRASFVKSVIGLVMTLINEAPCMCVGCHLSLCATIAKVTPTLVAEIPNAIDTETVSDCMTAAYAIFNTLCAWAMHCIVDTQLSMRGVVPSNHGRRRPQTSAPGVRYVDLSGVSAAEHATLISCSLQAAVQSIACVVKATPLSHLKPGFFSPMIKNIESTFDLVKDDEEGNMKGWLACVILNCSFLHLLKSIYLARPWGTSQSTRTVPQEVVTQISDLFSVLQTLLTVTLGAPKVAIQVFARELVSSGLFIDLLISLRNIEPALTAASSEGGKHLNFSVDIIKASNAPLWASCWILLIKVLLEMETRLLNRQIKADDPLHDLCCADWGKLPTPSDIMKAGSGSWQVLKSRELTLSETAIAYGRGRVPHWLAKQSNAKGIKRDSYCFVPSDVFVVDSLNRIKKAVGQAATSSSMQLGCEAVLPAGVVSLIHAGCWSPTCRNLSGQSEASLRTHICARCRMARYCCRSCQKADWLQHRAKCKPWEEVVVC